MAQPKPNIPEEPDEHVRIDLGEDAAPDDDPLLATQIDMLLAEIESASSEMDETLVPEQPSPAGVDPILSLDEQMRAEVDRADDTPPAPDPEPPAVRDPIEDSAIGLAPDDGDDDALSPEDTSFEQEVETLLAESGLSMQPPSAAKRKRRSTRQRATSTPVPPLETIEEVDDALVRELETHGDQIADHAGLPAAPEPPPAATSTDGARAGKEDALVFGTADDIVSTVVTRHGSEPEDPPSTAAKKPKRKSAPSGPPIDPMDIDDEPPAGAADDPDPIDATEHAAETDAPSTAASAAAAAATEVSAPTASIDAPPRDATQHGDALDAARDAADGELDEIDAVAAESRHHEAPPTGEAAATAPMPETAETADATERADDHAGPRIIAQRQPSLGGRLAHLPVAALAGINAPIARLSPRGRDIVGYLGLITLFNAIAVWIALLLFR